VGRNSDRPPRSNPALYAGDCHALPLDLIIMRLTGSDCTPIAQLDASAKASSPFTLKRAPSVRRTHPQGLIHAPPYARIIDEAAQSCTAHIAQTHDWHVALEVPTSSIGVQRVRDLKKEAGCPIAALPRDCCLRFTEFHLSTICGEGKLWNKHGL
jgi:hypothetical protein